MTGNTHSTPAGPSLPTGEQFDYFPFDARTYSLLPDEHEVVVNRLSGGMTLINWETRRCLVHVGFSDQELPVLMMLMDRWPSYVPYERLLPLMSEEEIDIDDLAQQIAEARAHNDQEKLAQICGPLRTILTTCHDRLYVLGLDISAVYQHGYLLIRYLPTKQRAVEEALHE